MIKQEILEEWKDIVGYEGLYRVSSYGAVVSIGRLRKGNGSQLFYSKERRLKPTKTGKNRNYLAVILSADGRSKCFKVHRLVARHFVSNPLSHPEVNHKDGNTFNNHFSNLEWVTTKENIAHALATGLATPLSSETRRKAHMANINRAVSVGWYLGEVVIRRYANAKEAAIDAGCGVGMVYRHINNQVQRPIWKTIS